MKTQEMLITPQIAERFLKENKSNRPPTERLISEYARQMKSGLWFEDTDESIKVDSSGLLVDGQHRLLALIRADVSLRFRVSIVPSEAYKYIDTGKKRTARDAFAHDGISNYTNVAAGLRRYVALKKGLSIGYDSGGISMTDIRTSNAELLALYSQSPNLYQGAYSNASSWYRKSGRLMRTTDIMAYYLCFSDLSADDAFAFMSFLFEGSAPDPRSPILLLRTRLLEDKTNTRYKISALIKNALIVKTWNLFRTKQTVLQLKFDVNRDKYPIAL